MGSGQGELNSPWGIAVDQQGYVYVADHKNHRAQKFTPEGEFVAEFGSYGDGRGQLNRPSDVEVDPDGDVYVCDWANDRVQVFGPDGRFITSFIGDAQQLAKWHQATVDANMDVIKARRRVYSLEPEWRFALPTAVAFDTLHSRLLVADTQRGRLQIYNKVQDYLEPQFNL
jgi:DNA-binding beta-propeller fold protein YncE